MRATYDKFTWSVLNLPLCTYVPQIQLTFSKIITNNPRNQFHLPTSKISNFSTLCCFFWWFYLEPRYIAYEMYLFHYYFSDTIWKHCVFRPSISNNWCVLVKFPFWIENNRRALNKQIVPERAIVGLITDQLLFATIFFLCCRCTHLFLLFIILITHYDIIFDTFIKIFQKGITTNVPGFFFPV